MKLRLEVIRITIVSASVLALVVGATAQDAAKIPAHGKLKPLFNGKNFKGFDTFLEKHGINSDPDKVFQVENGVLHISGAEMGGLVTQNEYQNYYLRAEFKWGENTYGSRAGKARDSGIQYHITGPLVVWPKMMEFQVSEGSVGDIWVVKGTSVVVRGTKYDSSGNPPYIRIPRAGRGELQNVTGFRQPQGEVENQHGEWNVLELVADHDRVMQFVNGKLVNEGTNASVTRGKIDFQSEGAEVYFRNMKIADLK